MSGHRSSRRQSYGRRLKDLRGRRPDDMVIDLDGPAGWLRWGAHAEDASRLDGTGSRPGVGRVQVAGPSTRGASA